MLENKKMIVSCLGFIVLLLCILFSYQVTPSQPQFLTNCQDKQDRQQFIKSSTLHKNIGNLLMHGEFDSNQSSPITTYGLNFLQLTFAMDDQQLRSLVFEIGKLIPLNPDSLLYLPLYFIKACERLESQKTPHYFIHSLVQQRLKFILKITSVSQFQREKPKLEGHSDTMPLQWNKIESAVQSFSFERLSLTSDDKSSQIEDIIMQMVLKAQRNERLFEDLISNSCKTSKAESFKFNYKIKQKQQTLQMKRIKEKLLRNYLEEEYKICFNSFFMMQNHMQQIKHFQEVIHKILLNKTDIEFVVKDILRAKCQFTKHEQIYQTALSIVSQVQELKKKGKQIKLVEFENRLDRPICDILLVVEIENLGYQIQLALDSDKSLYMINHKVYEFSRSLVFNPISMLFFEFDIIASKVEAKIEKNLAFEKAGTNNRIEKQRGISIFGETRSLGDVMLGFLFGNQHDLLEMVNSKVSQFVVPFALIDSLK